MTNKQAYAGLLEHVIGVRDYRRRTFKEMEVEGDGVDTALTQAAQAISSLLNENAELYAALDRLEYSAATYRFDKTPANETALAQAQAEARRVLMNVERARAALNSDAPLSIGEGL